MILCSKFMIRYFSFVAILALLSQVIPMELEAMGFFDKFKKKPTMSINDAAMVLSSRILETSAMNAETVKKFYEETLSCIS